MVRKGDSIAVLFAALTGIFVSWSGRQVTRYMDGVNPTSIDVLMQLWHDCRRSKDDIQRIRDRVVALGAAAAFRAYAEQQVGGTYDVLTETQSFVGSLTALQNAIVTAVGGVDADGYINGPYIKLSTNAPFLRQVPAADCASAKIAFEAVIGSIAE